VDITRFPVVEIEAGARQGWVAPQLRKLDAGSAENADQAGTDDGVNLS
jgi:hypothetical protein